MESFSGETEESTEDITGRKKSKLKSLRTRLFGKSKRAGAEGNAKLSQSVSDITAGKGLGSEEDLACSQGIMGSRALSHDSIFLADQVLTEAEPARVLSQENVHSKIKALQMKLQQQKMHLGPPPMVLPVKRQEDLERRSEDEGLPHSPTEIPGSDVTIQAAFSKSISQQSSFPLSPLHKPAPAKHVPPLPSHPLPLSVSSNSSAAESPSDFSSPAQFTPCLDTSAARHRMSVKPRNQRASTKKRPPATDSQLNTLNNIDHPESLREEEQQESPQEAARPELDQEWPVGPIASQLLPSKSPEVEPITPEAASKSSSLTFPQQDQALPERTPTVPPHVLRVKPPRPVDAMPSERPHSAFMQSDKREGGFEGLDKRNALNKPGATDQVSSNLSPVEVLRSSLVQQQVQGVTEATRGIKRPGQGSGSFHFSITTAKNRDGERPRSGSFVGVTEQIAARNRLEERPFSSMKEKEEPRGAPFAVGRLRQEGAQQKSPFVPWERRDALKKVETAAGPKNVTTDPGAVEGEKKESSQEVVEEAREAREVEEEEAKTAFGIKLRSTSHSLKFRSDVSHNQNTKAPVSEEQGDREKKEEKGENGSYTLKKVSTNIPCTQSVPGDQRLTDPSPSDFSLPVKHSPPSASDPPVVPADVHTASSDLKEVESAVTAPQEPQSTPQASSADVSWVSLAMEKTKSLHQLFTSRFPRDFTGAQTAARPQAQVQTCQAETPTGTQTHTQTVKVQQGTITTEASNQPLNETVTETLQSRNQKPSISALQQKTSLVHSAQSNFSKETQVMKQTSEPLKTTTPVSHPAAQTIPWTSQPPLHTPTHTDNTSQCRQGSVTQSLAQSYLSSSQQQLQQQQQHQPPWSNRVLHPTANQLRSTTPTPTSVSTTVLSATATTPTVSVLGKRDIEATAKEKEGSSPIEKKAVWAGSVSEKAAFLGKRAEWTTGTKGVELKKAQPEVQATGEPVTSAETTPIITDRKPEGLQWSKPTESSPRKVPDGPREEKWLRKNVASSSSPSSSPSSQPAMSDSGQPSWMELAKRKSMAWSDKTMD